MDTSKIILVTGGARSGKSAFAERYAAALPGRHAYVATARIFDEEMAQRIAIHRKRRPSSWQTWEIPQDLPETMERLCQSSDVALVDCLTLYFLIISLPTTAKTTKLSSTAPWPNCKRSWRLSARPA